jgi:DNA uptake protein ComE-like DNA-binding protein
VYTNKADMMRLYGMSEEMYAQAQAWLQFPSKPTSENKKPIATKTLEKSGGWDTLSPVAGASVEFTEEEVILFDINSADTLQLRQIRGIGPVLASRIVRYRDLLGGFYSPNQLREVYGLSEETLERLWETAVIDSLGVEKTIRINATEDPAELARHPYLNFREARAIINYRNQHGPYSHWEELKSLYALPDSTLLKIKPYIKLDDENP